MDATNTKLAWITKVTGHLEVHIPDRVAVPAGPGDYVRIRILAVYDWQMDHKPVEPFEIVRMVQSNSNISLTKELAMEKGIGFGDRVKVEFVEKKEL